MGHDSKRSRGQPAFHQTGGIDFKDATNPCLAFMQTRGSPSPWMPFEKPLVRLISVLRHRSVISGRAEIFEPVPGWYRWEDRGVLQKDHPGRWTSSNRFGDLGRQSISYPHFHRRGKRVFDGSGWFWKSNDFPASPKKQNRKNLPASKN